MSAYCWKLIAPIHLNAYYVFVPVRTLRDPHALTAILFLILAAVAIVYGLRRAPLSSFAALWVFISLIPALNVYAVGRNVFAERYLYLPSVGFCFLIALIAARAGDALPVRFRSSAAAVVSAAVLLLYAVQTFARNPVWKDDTTLFTRTLESSPNAPFVQNMVAAVQPNNAIGQDSAVSHYLRAISLAENEAPPNRLEMAIAGEGLASIYAARGEFEQALRALTQVRAADPKDAQVDGEEGLILMQANRWSEAQAALRRAVAITPNDANVLMPLDCWPGSMRAILTKPRRISPGGSAFIRRPTISMRRCTAISERFTESRVVFPMPSRNSRSPFKSRRMTRNTSRISPPPSRRLAAPAMPGGRSRQLSLLRRITILRVSLLNRLGTSRSLQS
jgi:tetratricopeptide (TPR) repeat protein